MNRLGIIALCGWLSVVTAIAQTTEEQYVRIYNLIQQGNALEAAGRPDDALPKFLEANTALQQIKKQYPDWNPKVVDFRLRYLADKIESRSGSASTPPPTASSGGIAPVVVPPPRPASGTTPGAPGEWQQQLLALQESVRRLQSDKLVLEAKLKEALATQPAAIDPRELARTQERVQGLLKENELLKAGLEEEKKRVTGGEAKELEQARKQLAEANAKLAERATANAALEQRLAALSTGSAAAEALRTENELLKKQLAEARTTPMPAPAAGDVTARLAEAEARIASLQSDLDVVRLERIALETRLKKAMAAPRSGLVSREADVKRIQDLERERSELQQRLETASRQNATAQSREYAAKVDQLSREVVSLKSRVEVFEAKAIPYAAEELALFKQTPPAPAAVPDVKTESGRRVINQLPAGTVALVAQAERAFAAKDYDKAEENYLAILRQDERNAYTHANLGAIKLEQGKLAEAEEHLNRALALAPDDAYTVALQGYLKFRQEQYDDAITVLNRAAQLNPQNAEVQNYLGVTLSHKGLRGPAEQAFRRAVVLNPAHAGAQHNLAVFYASENPPNVPLARFHYQRALANGHPRNEALEQLFTKKEAANP